MPHKPSGNVHGAQDRSTARSFTVAYRPRYLMRFPMQFVIIINPEIDPEEANRVPETDLYGPFKDAETANQWVTQVAAGLPDDEPFVYIITKTQWPPAPSEVAEYLLDMR